MNIVAKTVMTAAPAQFAPIPCDALIIGIYAAPASTDNAKKGNAKSNAKSGVAYTALDSVQAVLTALALSPASTADLPTALGKTHTVYPASGAAVAAARVIFVGLGEAKSVTAKSYTKALRAALADCTHGNIKTVVNGLMDLPVADLDTQAKARFTLSLAHEVCYRYDQTLSKKASPIALSTLLLPCASKADEAAAKQGAMQGAAIGQGANITRELANLPANICTPSYLAKQARITAKQFSLACEVLERKHLQALKMGSFLSVAAGSDEPPRLIVLKYSGAKNAQNNGLKNTAKGSKKSAPVAPYVLIGKGVTFDTGGISLKPGLNMDEMKYDMCGAASVLGTMHAVAAMGLPIDVVAIVVATENMPNGHATKPGDVVTSMSGQTIEILNTDAEGRLILCDALTYAQRFNPAAVVDVATLTGACVVALGAVNSGLYGNNEALVDALLTASKSSQDAAWHMPMGEEYHEQLKSNFADMANIGGMPGGSVTAACFLSKFAGAYPWAHLDIAGTAWKGGAAKGATGRPVGLLAQYLINVSQA